MLAVTCQLHYVTYNAASPQTIAILQRVCDQKEYFRRIVGHLSAVLLSIYIYIYIYAIGLLSM